MRKGRATHSIPGGGKLGESKKELGVGAKGWENEHSSADLDTRAVRSLPPPPRGCSGYVVLGRRGGWGPGEGSIPGLYGMVDGWVGGRVMRGLGFYGNEGRWRGGCHGSPLQYRGRGSGHPLPRGDKYMLGTNPKYVLNI